MREWDMVFNVVHGQAILQAVHKFDGKLGLTMHQFVDEAVLRAWCDEHGIPIDASDGPN